MAGFEPTRALLENAMLPLHHIPSSAKVQNTVFVYTLTECCLTNQAISPCQRKVGFEPTIVCKYSFQIAQYTGRDLNPQWFLGRAVYSRLHYQMCVPYKIMQMPSQLYFKEPGSMGNITRFLISTAFRCEKHICKNYRSKSSVCFYIQCFTFKLHLHDFTTKAGGRNRTDISVLT